VKRELPDACGVGVAEAAEAIAAQRKAIEKCMSTELRNNLYQ
jgi:hypothetical protein